MKRNNKIIKMQIGAKFFSNPLFLATLDLAKKFHLPCFLLIDDTMALPVNWDLGLNIVYLDYYKDKYSFQSKEKELEQSIVNYILETKANEITN